MWDLILGEYNLKISDLQVKMLNVYNLNIIPI